ncbi:MAG TPA: hypothetical protein VFQ42_22155 [Mycobacterium sp.]|nr:hypothetical protein [Mycobacterium sp.]
MIHNSNTTTSDLTVEIVRCANGHDFTAIIINGTRITNSKCCGRWTTVRKFKVQREVMAEAIAEAPAERAVGGVIRSFTSRLVRHGDFPFPEFTGLRVMMMPVIIGRPDSLPDHSEAWRAAFGVISVLAHEHYGSVGYLTVDEAEVPAGETHRRPGMHVDGYGTDAPAPYGGGGRGYGGGDDLGGGTGMLCAATCAPMRVWTGTIAGSPGIDGSCEHMRGKLGAGAVLEPNVAYWCSPMLVHEAMPMSETGRRQFVRLSLPSSAPWHEGYTPNPMAQPTGPILPARAEMGYRP